MYFELGSVFANGVADADRGQDMAPLSGTGGVIIDRNPCPCLSPFQVFMLRGELRCCRTTILFCRLAIFPSVNEDSSGEAVHPVVPPLGHHQSSCPVPREVPHGRWITRSRWGATPVCAWVMMGRNMVPTAVAPTPARKERLSIR